MSQIKIIREYIKIILYTHKYILLLLCLGYFPVMWQKNYPPQDPCIPTVNPPKNAEVNHENPQNHFFYINITWTFFNFQGA